MAERDKISIFLIDDNSILLSIVKRFLQENNTVTVEAMPGGEDTLQQIQLLQPDIVLIDPFSPNALGLKGISRLRATAPKSVIIVTALFNTDGYRQAVLAAGADDFVPKESLAIDLPPIIHQVTKNGIKWEKSVRVEQVLHTPASNQAP
jgi:DNA-binding NarL/FixJ family response regulator